MDSIFFNGERTETSISTLGASLLEREGKRGSLNAALRAISLIVELRLDGEVKRPMHPRRLPSRYSVTKTPYPFSLIIPTGESSPS